MTGETEKRQEIAEAGRALLREGLAARTWGNISARAGDAAMLITPSGLGYEGMTAADIVFFDMAADAWEGQHKPSSEKGVHAAAYRAFPDAGFVMHTHQTYASAIGLIGFDALELTGEEAAALGGVALADYALPGTQKLAGNVAAAFGTGARTVLMARHGAVIAGAGCAQVFDRARLLERVCRRAAKGQPADYAAFDAGLSERLAEAARQKFGHAACARALPVLACAAGSGSLAAQLDDAAQMIGPRLYRAKPGEGPVLRALERHNAVLVPGAGALCRASSAGDLAALCLLVEKACVSYLHTRALGLKKGLTLPEAMLMRYIYVKKYSGKIGG